MSCLLAFLLIAQVGEPDPLKVQVETKGGSRVTGTVRLRSIKVDCDLGILEIKADKIKSLEFSGGGGQPIVSAAGEMIEGTIITTSGSKFHGSMTIPALTMETDLGTLTLVPSKLRSISFQPEASRDDAPRPGRIELKPDPKAESAKPAAEEDRPARPNPIPRYLTHPSASKVTRIGAVVRPESCGLAPANAVGHVAAQSASRKRRVIGP